MRTIPNWAKAILTVLAVWLAVAFSLGWYYAGGRSGWALWPGPSPEACATVLLYRLSIESVGTGLQTILWFLLFPCVALAWAGVLATSAPYFGGERMAIIELARRLAIAAIPLVLPGPVLAFMAGRIRGGFSWDRMLNVASDQPAATNSTTMTAVFIGLAIAALCWQFVVYRQALRVSTRVVWGHYLLSLIAFALMLAGLSMAIALPTSLGLV